MGVLDESENHTPFSLTQGGTLDHDATPNSAGLPAPFDEDNNVDDELPFLSVLNTVIDHCMMDPTPMEPKEFEKRQKVPVMRVFGPVVRGGSEEEPLQSCCLYIHGAFPYLLARPAAAGPDGSSTAASGGEGHVDWDCVASVEAVVPQLQANLEGMIQDSLGASSSSNAIKSCPTKVIRAVSVVVGRGFYTYCPGPAAPFLRVEYYDPKLRWKVKMMLERGLDLPTSFHPDPQQYDQLKKNNAATEASSLAFHCYEAHIPYTMQFFKDWNLAGMSYIHLSEGGKLRTPLPKSYRPRTKSISSSSSTNLFVQDNTDTDHIWGDNNQSLSYDSREGNLLRQSSSVDDSSQESKTIQQKREPVWRKKETSCDVEFDCTVDQILNIRTVLTSKSDDDSVHWRAVPSLREIWRQERRRMSLLLPPKEDFLSQAPTTPPFTLNVKKGASMPGARMAVLGMKKLFRVSLGLEQEFTRAMKQIICRYSQQVLQTDRLLSDKKQGNLLLENVALTQDSSAPDDDDALEALAALGGQFDQDTGMIESLSDRVTNSPKLSQIPDDEYEESAVLFSQRVDRGESVEESQYEHVEDYIDPNTLAPYDDDEEDEEEHMDEREFEHTLSMLASDMMRKESEDTAKPPAHSQQEQVDWTKVDSSFGSDDNADEDVLEPILEETTQTMRYSTTQTTPTSIPRPKLNGQGTIDVVGKLIVPVISPPTRAEVESREVAGTNSRHLNQLERHRRIPTWLSHSSRYMALRESLLARKVVTSTWGPRRSEGKFTILPVAKPPTREEVELWCCKQERHNGMPKRDLSKKLNSKDRGHPSKFAGVNLQIDDNSRKLTAVPNTSRKRKRVEFSGGAQEVEEVEWVTSQPIPSQSQSNSQNEIPSKPHVKECTPRKYSTDDNPQSGNSSSQLSGSANHSESQESAQPLDGIGQQGGKIYIAGGGGLKTKTKASPKKPGIETSQVEPKKKGISSLELPNPLTIMSIEIHVQCRTGRAGVNDSKEIAMRPNADKDKISAIVYVYARDPGGGEAMQILERGCLFVPVEAELKGKQLNGSHARNLSKRMEASLPRATMGVPSDLTVESVRDEKQLLLRLSSIVRWKDPDMLLSWDPQGGGLGYLIERGAILGKSVDSSRNSPQKKSSVEVDMVRLLGRLPTARKEHVEGIKSFFGGDKSEIDHKEIDKSKGDKETMDNKNQWKGSGLGAEWDERVGAGTAAASIVSLFLQFCTVETPN